MAGRPTRQPGENKAVPYGDIPPENRPWMASLRMVKQMLDAQREAGEFEDQVSEMISEIAPKVRQWPTEFLEKWRTDLDRCRSSIKKADPELWTVPARGNLSLMQAQDYLCEEWLRYVNAELYQRSPETQISGAPSGEPGGIIGDQAAEASELRSQPDVVKRRAIVVQNPSSSAAYLCKRFDFKNVPLPAGWENEVQNWTGAYRMTRYQSRIHTIISKDRGHR